MPRELARRRRRLVEGVRDEQAARREPLREPRERRAREPVRLVHRAPAPDEEILDDQIEAPAQRARDRRARRPRPPRRRARRARARAAPRAAPRRSRSTPTIRASGASARRTRATLPPPSPSTSSERRRAGGSSSTGAARASQTPPVTSLPGVHHEANVPSMRSAATASPHAHLDASAPRSLARALRINSRHERSPVRAAGA